MRKLIYIPIVILIIFTSSCQDFLTIGPKGEASKENMKTPEGVNKLALGAYAVLDGVPGTTGSGRWASAVSNWVWGGVVSDNAYKGTVHGDQNPINSLENFTVEPQNVYIANHWKDLYEGIRRVNETLKIMGDTDMPKEEKAEIEAEMRFLRAHFYVELTRVHGPVPYIDENTEDPSTVPNDHLVWPEIEKDFNFAINNLPTQQDQIGRPTSWAAKTYLAYTYLYQQRYKDAKPLLNDIYSNGPFSLVPDYQQNYLINYNNNSESIFEIQYAVNDGSTSGDGANAGPGDSIIGGIFMGGSSFYQPTHSLVSAFRVNQDGLPLLNDTYSEDDILPFDPQGKTVPYKGPVDPRLDITVGRPGVPFLDWGIHQGNTWIRDPKNGGPYLTKKQMYLQSQKNQLSQISGRTFPNANNYRKFKLSNVILWLAECEIEIGSLHKATDLVNKIRNRAKQTEVVKFKDGTPAANYNVEPYPTDFPTKEYGRKAVRHEERIEFAMEGRRFYNLVRWGIVAKVMNNYFDVESSQRGYLKGANFVKDQNEIWPIPQKQIDISLDKNGEHVLKQNPGY